MVARSDEATVTADFRLGRSRLPMIFVGCRASTLVVDLESRSSGR
jgi:hypothetical protein